MKKLVVARYRENIQWTHEIEGWDVWVLMKDFDLPNEGREASTYFHALHELYDDLENDDLVACVQGNPGQHAPQLFMEINHSVDRFLPLGQWRVITDHEGYPHHPGLPLAEKAEEWGIEAEFPLCFVAGAQFIVTGEAVKSRPKSYYAEMKERMSEEHAPWIMERLWARLFDYSIRSQP